MLDQHEGWARALGKDSPLKDFPLLTAYYNRFLDLEELKCYFASEVAQLTYNSPIAQTYVGGGGYGPRVA